MRLQEVFESIQPTIDKISDPTARKIYAAGCCLTAIQMANQTDPNNNTIALDFEQAYEDIRSFKAHNGI